MDGNEQPRPLDRLPEMSSAGSRWAALRHNDRMSFLFWYDQLKLRYQYAITRAAKPEPSWWKRKKIKIAIERLFEDIDEEIYFKEKFKKEVKGVEAEKKRALAREQQSREDLGEVLAGYDRFTVEEERKIREMTQKAIERLLAVEKEKGII